jgi:hypothetical protein
MKAVAANIPSSNIVKDDAFFPNGKPFLRVVASWPNQPTDTRSPCVVLRNSECTESMNQDKFMETLMEKKFQLKRRPMDQTARGLDKRARV